MDVINLRKTKPKRPVLLLVFFFFFSFAGKAQSHLQLKLISDPNSLNLGCLSISGFDEKEVKTLSKIASNTPLWRQALQVRIYLESSEKTDDDLPPMFGEYWAEDSVIIFKPRFPFISGRNYVVQYRGLSNEYDLQQSITIPDSNHELAEVLTIYPTANVLPQNLLKIYIHFSEPMGNASAYPHIQLFNSHRKLVNEPFLKLEPELWDKERKRFTLWFDPGRIKRDLIPNQKMGLPLQVGKQYTLVIKKAWKGAVGQELKSDFTKEFSVVEPDRVKPNQHDWAVSYPKANTKDPISINFKESMDRAVMESVIVVFDSKKNVELGALYITENEGIWQFMPKNPWKQQQYFIRISNDLEDLAGNNLQRLFDTDITNSADQTPKIGEYIEIPFEPENK